MNAFSRVILWGGLCLSLLASSLSAAESSVAERTGPPDLDALVRAGRATLLKLKTHSATWVTEFRLSKSVAFQARVISESNRKLWMFTLLRDDKKDFLYRIIETNTVWQISGFDHEILSRPYEAEIPLAGAYNYIAPSELMYVVDKERLANAVFNSRQGGVLYFRIPVPPENRSLWESLVAEMKSLQSQGIKLEPAQEMSLQTMQDTLKHGEPLRVDEKTGLVVYMKVKHMTITFKGFEWLDQVPEKAFKPIPTPEVKDQSQSIVEADLIDWIVVGRDPSHDEHTKKPVLDGHLLNLKTGATRRVPYRGSASMGGTFLKDRREVVVAGLDTISELMGLVKIDLISGKNTLIASEESGMQMILPEDLSPDGKKLVTLSMLGGEKISDFQVSVLDLETEELRRIGKPVPILSPIAWLPDGDGFVMARTDLVDDPKTIAPRYLCRMDMDGNLKDLRRGSYPVVLHKARRILYEDENDMWHTCDLDGANPILFADGLKEHGLPSLSPDEKHLLFVHFQKGKVPQIKLFEVGKAEGKSVSPEKGFTTIPVWR